MNLFLVFKKCKCGQSVGCMAESDIKDGDAIDHEDCNLDDILNFCVGCKKEFKSKKDIHYEEALCKDCDVSVLLDETRSKE